MPALRSALRHRNFRLLWLAQTASLIGDRIVTVAIALYVIDLTGSATDLGFVLAAGALPLITLMLIGGVWADRLPRHRLMVSTDLIRFVLHALLAVLILTGGATILGIVVIEALFGCAEAFFRPAVSGLVPQTVPDSEIQEANALLGLVDNVSGFLGPALATALVVGLGAGTAFAVDAATFLLSAALLIRMEPRSRTDDRRKSRAEERASTWTEIREGFDEVRSREWVWVTLAGFCVAIFAWLAPWFVLGPVIAEAEYGRPEIYGVVTAGIGVGTIAGSLLAIRWRPLHPMRLAAIGALLWPPAGLLFALGAPLGAVIPATVAGGVGVALFEVWWLTALAERIPPDRLSRVSSYDWTASLGLLPIGYLLAGPLAGAIGPSEVMAGGSAIACLALAAMLLSRDIRGLERIQTPLPEPPSEEMRGPIPVP